MILNAVQLFLERLLFHSTTLSISLAFLVVLLLWRIWTFTILPILHPDEPKELPYWTPVLGHTLAFFKDAHGTLTSGREYFHDNLEPYAITVAGEKLYVLTLPEDVSSAYKNTTTLRFDGFVRDLMTSIGVSPLAMEKLWQSPAEDSSTNRLRKPLVHLVSDLYIKQLLPGEELDAFTATFTGYIDKSLRWETMTDKYVLASTADEKRLSLLNWCGEILVTAVTHALFGKKLLEIEPEILQAYFDFNDDGWMMFYKYPRFAAKKMYAAKAKVIDALTSYLQLPRELRPGASWLIQSIEDEQRKLGLNERDMARLLMMVYWAANSNAYKLCFWVLAYILHHHSLLSTIRAETAPALNTTSATPIDISYLLTMCPRLEALFHEVLRISNSSASVRAVVAPTYLGSKVLRAGTKVLIPHRQLHSNRSIFGPNASSFDAERFLRQKELSRNPGYRPFGGGSTYCPGRIVARQEIFAFVALALQRFEVGLTKDLGDGTGTKAGAQAFPRLDEMTPSLGVMAPLKGDDVLVTVKVRACEKKLKLDALGIS